MKTVTILGILGALVLWLGGVAPAGLDFEGVSCDACHKMTDPVRGMRQTDDLPLEALGTLARTEADKTYTQDLNVLSPLRLFDGTAFFNPANNVPTFFGPGPTVGSLPHYIEATSGQYFMDGSTPKRGPRFDADPKHQWYYSRFHSTKYHCATCHDVSNPVLGRHLSGDLALPEKQAAASYAHVERTFSEFMSSAYGRDGGAPVNAALGLPAGTKAAKCQDCHMRDVTGTAANKAGLKTRSDLALHDLTGGNVWISGILASADAQNAAIYSANNYAILSGARYPGAKVDVAGLQGFGAALKDGQARALQQLKMAATLEKAGEDFGKLTLRLVNNTGHKLISGFPEGRRIWLNVRFYNDAGALLGEINPYVPLTVLNAATGDVAPGTGTLQVTEDELVYEAGFASTITGEEHSFHFVLGTSRVKDNRIPPKGFDVFEAAARLALPVREGGEDKDCFSAAEYLGGYDEVSLDKPAGTTRWEAALYYQTTSREYVEFLRDEINGTAATLPAGSYRVQTDPYFASLKDWGRAIWDLWLGNGGCPPVLMASLANNPVMPPCEAPAPAGLKAAAGKRKVTLSWTAAPGATSYKVYYAQSGKYTLRGTTTGTGFTDSGLVAGQNYCYAVTAMLPCNGASVESVHSTIVCATPTR